jgi:hypothetical protein
MSDERPDVELELRRLELEIKKRELELPVELAQLGLRGTLTGALAGCTVVLALAIIRAFSDRLDITGAHLCIIMGIVAIAVALYGGFVFQRSVTIGGRWKDNGLSVGTGESKNFNSDRDAPNPPLKPDA